MIWYKKSKFTRSDNFIFVKSKNQNLIKNFKSKLKNFNIIKINQGAINFPKVSLKNVKNVSKYFLLKLNKIKDEYPNLIKAIRGRGLLIGIQLHTDQVKFIKKLMDNKLLTIRAAENVVRILPPLNVKKNEINQALRIIKKVCSEIN